ncbi:bacteriocin activator [Lactobacillus plantarum] [Lactiplantibacillus mudanjiangensis]|nr:bacteriocin activator [Lactobacillus plantarum] [Lactiplantibacillus mudanjiangensis]
MFFVFFFFFFLFFFFQAEDGIRDSSTSRGLGDVYKRQIIYFAVDVDIQDGDIAGTIAPYFTGVASGIAGFDFNVGFTPLETLSIRLLLMV